LLNSFLVRIPATTVPAITPPTDDKIAPADNLPIPDILRDLRVVLRFVVLRLRDILFIFRGLLIIK
jgi:hypothetical protein